MVPALQVMGLLGIPSHLLPPIPPRQLAGSLAARSPCQELKSLWNIGIYKGFYGILWNYMEFYGMLKHSIEIPPISMECRGIP